MQISCLTVHILVSQLSVRKLYDIFATFNANIHMKKSVLGIFFKRPYCVSVYPALTDIQSLRGFTVVRELSFGLKSV